MNRVRQNGASRVSRLGGALVGLAAVAVAVAYPPPIAGLAPLFGLGTVFVPLIVSVVSLFVAIAGGVLLARGLVTARAGRPQRLLVRVLLPVGAAAVVGAYLVVVAGFGPRSSFVLVAVGLAAVAGVADELATGSPAR